jgi:hypothetical protein
MSLPNEEKGVQWSGQDNYESNRAFLPAPKKLPA